MTDSKLKITLEYLQKQDNIILLDDSSQNKSGKNKESFLFINPIKELIAFEEKDFFDALAQIDKLSQKYYLAGYINYEAGHFFTEKNHRPNNTKQNPKQPLLYFGVYKQPIKCHVEQKPNLYTPYIKKLSALSEKAYIDKIKKIKNEIALGNTYQVNYTFNQKISAACDPAYFYLFLRNEQGTSFGAYIKNQYINALCFSPELFFKRENDIITTKPMKGTAQRGKSIQEDKNNLQELQTCEKNQAENLMIVDLIRNDLSHIAVPHSVKVDNLFGTETHKTLHQMTSTIKAKLKPNTSYQQIFKALFPCGSITGTPKIKTMSLINELENHSRGIYCGTIGYISPDKTCAFNIPIRTLQKTAKAKNFDYKAGSGIVWDSDPAAEYQECLLKTSFITDKQLPPFEIVETLLLKEHEFTFAQEHINRMKKSAHFFKYPFPEQKIKCLFLKLQKQTGSHMVRLLLRSTGEILHETIKITENTDKKYVTLAKIKTDAANIFLTHKTTYRPWYEQSMAKIKTGLVWDEIFINNKGYVTEGARSNIFIKKNDSLYTPKKNCGLLNGILRSNMLTSGQCHEKNLTPEDIKRADQLYCGNSVRGLQPVTLK